MALTLAFKLEVVLGAFAAGIVLRQVLPRGDESLELKIEGLAFGLLIPCFFITSGMGIDPRAVADRPLLLLGFLSLILLVRGVPVYLATRLERSSNGRQVFSGRDSLRIALYGATGLPIIVAVASVAVRNGQMAAQSAWLVVAAGAVTVLLLPTSATLIGHAAPVVKPHRSLQACRPPMGVARAQPERVGLIVSRLSMSSGTWAEPCSLVRAVVRVRFSLAGG